DQDRAALHQAQLVGAGAADLEDQLGIEGGGAVDDLGAGRGIGLVGGTGRYACAGLHQHLVAPGLELLRRLGRHRHTCFAWRRLQWNAYAHARSPPWLARAPGLVGAVQPGGKALRPERATWASSCDFTPLTPMPPTQWPPSTMARPPSSRHSRPGALRKAGRL